MKKKSFQVLILVVLVSIVGQGCALDFSAGNFQGLKIFFKLTQSFATGEAAIVHTWFFPGAVNTKRKFVRVAGALTPPNGGSLPSTVTVLGKFEDLDTGRQLFKVNMKIKVKADGTFSISKKLKKNIAADSMLVVTVNPAGKELEQNTSLTLCVDVVAKKADIKSLPVCAEGGALGAATLTELQRDIFTPSCDSFGCHNVDSAGGGLVLVAGQSFAELVNTPSEQVPSFDRVEPNDPENSYLIKKLRGDADIEGDRMPQDGPFLSDAEVARVVSWINAGAPDN